MNLYGNDMDESTHPFESGARLDGGARAAPSATSSAARRSKRSTRAGAPRKLVGLLLEDRGVLRGHQKVHRARRRRRARSPAAPSRRRSSARSRFARVPAGTGATRAGRYPRQAAERARREAAVRALRQVPDRASIQQHHRRRLIHEQCSRRSQVHQDPRVGAHAARRHASRSASPITRSTRSATWCSSRCPRRARREGRRAVRGGRVGEGRLGCLRPLAGEVIAGNPQLGQRAGARSTGSLRRGLAAAAAAGGRRARAASCSSPAEYAEAAATRRAADGLHSPHRGRRRGTCSRPSASPASSSCSTRSRSAAQSSRSRACRTALNEMQIGRLMSERARTRRPAAVLHRRRRLRAPHSGGRVGHHHARRVLQRLHAVPGGGEPGHAAADLRIPDDDRAASRAWRCPTPRCTTAPRRWPKPPHGGARQSQVASRSASSCRRRVHPHYRKVAVATAGNQGLRSRSCRTAPTEGARALEALARYEGEDITALVIQQPNFFGRLEDVDALTDWAHARGILVIAVVNPTSLALLKPPGEWGAHGCRHRRRRRPAARRAAVLRRPVLRLHDHAHGVRAPDARAASSGARSMLAGQRGLHAHAAGARAAHPPRQGDLQHLHQPGPAGDGGDDLPVAHGAAGPGARRRRLARAHARARGRADARARRARGLSAGPYFHEAVLQLDRPVAPVLKALAARGILGGLDLAEHYPRARACAAGVRHRDQDRRATSSATRRARRGHAGSARSLKRRTDTCHAHVKK